MPRVLDSVEKPKLELFMSMAKPPQAARTRDRPVMPPAWSMMSTPPVSAHA